MKLSKRIERQSDRLKVEDIKLLFLVDEIQKELNDLSPGETLGERGVFLAKAIRTAHVAEKYVVAAYHLLDEVKAGKL